MPLGAGSIRPKPLVALPICWVVFPTPLACSSNTSFQHPGTGQVWDHWGTTGTKVPVVTGFEAVLGRVNPP